MEHTAGNEYAKKFIDKYSSSSYNHEYRKRLGREEVTFMETYRKPPADERRKGI